MYIKHITELCEISGTYAQACRDSGGQQHRQPREGGSAGHVHHNAELSGQRSAAGKLITSDDIATVIAVCVCVSSKYVYVCLLTLQTLVPSPPLPLTPRPSFEC